MSFDVPERDPESNELHEHALHAYHGLLEHRGDDPLLRANADDTKRWLEHKGLPADDPDFLASAVIGALTVYQKAADQALAEIDQGPTGMTELTRASGQMATGAVIELGMLLEDALNATKS